MNFKPSDRLNEIPTSFFAGLDEKIANFKTNTSIIDLSKGNPDLPTPQNIVNALKKAADDPINDAYTPFEGKASLQQAISDFYEREYHVEIDPTTEVEIFNGAAVGIYALPQVILNPNDIALVPDPYYPEYIPAIQLAGGHIYHCPLLAQNHYLPDYPSIPTEISDKAKLLFLNYPNNPTGATATQAFFEKTIAFAKQHHLIAVNDFAYASLGFDSHPLSLLQIPGAKETAVEIYTLSKTYSMAGWRIGFAVGNADVIASLKKYHAHVYSTVYGAVQDAAIEALSGSQDGAVKIRKAYRQRRDLFVSGLRKLQFDVQPAAGTFFVWVRAPQQLTGQQFADQLLKQAGIAVAPGIGFGKEGQQYVRFSLVHSDKTLKEVLSRLQKMEGSI